MCLEVFSPLLFFKGSCHTLGTMDTVDWGTPCPTPSFSMKVTFLSWSFGLRSRLQIWQTSKGWWSWSHEHRLWTPSRGPLFALFQLTSIFQEEAYTLMWSPDFCEPHSRYFQITGGDLMHTAPQNCIYIWMLLPEVLESSQPVSSCWDPPLWDTDRSWHTLNYWELLKI